MKKHFKVEFNKVHCDLWLPTPVLYPVRKYNKLKKKN